MRAPFTSMYSRDDKSQEFTKILEKTNQDVTNSVVPRENQIAYTHGLNWARPDEMSKETTQKMSVHSASANFSHQKLIDHELSFIEEFLNEMAEDMKKQMYTYLYQIVSEGAERVGNVVDAQDFQSPIDVYKEAIKKIAPTVDRYGIPSRPEIHLAPEQGQALALEFERIQPEVEIEIEQLWAEKDREATSEETLRLSKYW